MIRPLKTHQVVVDLVLAGLFAAIMLPIELSVGRMVENNALSTVIVTLGMAGALALRRLSPGLALAVAWAAAIAQMAFVRSPSPADLAVFAVLYATAAYGGRRVFWLGFTSSIVGAVVITAYLFLGPWAAAEPNPRVISVAVAVLIASFFGLLLAWTVGALVRTAIRAQANRVAREKAEVEAIAEQQRVRIARDMHDIVAHSLAVVIAQADGARYALAAAGPSRNTEADSDTAAEAFETIASTARAALADVRQLLTQLRHSQGEGPQPALADLAALYAQVRASGIDLRIVGDRSPFGEPPAAVQLALFRILQEALTNAIRHGAPGPVRVSFAWHVDRVELTVSNPVRVRAVNGAASVGHGLIGMRERAQLVGGTLTSDDDSAVFVVRCALPIAMPA